MNSHAQAFIRWIPRESGGRRSVPTAPYSTVARFEDDENWPHEAWSLVVRVHRSYRGGGYTYATVEFLAEGAPDRLLAEGSRFELMEGSARVAKGVVLPPTVDVPQEINDFESALVG
jgi:hypothetical protein